jgi:hypothetical protein
MENVKNLLIPVKKTKEKIPQKYGCQMVDVDLIRP